MITNIIRSLSLTILVGGLLMTGMPQQAHAQYAAPATGDSNVNFRLHLTPYFFPDLKSNYEVGFFSRYNIATRSMQGAITPVGINITPDPLCFTNQCKPWESMFSQVSFGVGPGWNNDSFAVYMNLRSRTSIGDDTDTGLGAITHIGRNDLFVTNSMDLRSFNSLLVTLVDNRHAGFGLMLGPSFDYQANVVTGERRLLGGTMRFELGFLGLKSQERANYIDLTVGYDLNNVDKNGNLAHKFGFELQSGLKF